MNMAIIIIETYFVKGPARTLSNITRVKSFMTKLASGQLHTIISLIYDLYAIEFWCSLNILRNLLFEIEYQ